MRRWLSGLIICVGVCYVVPGAAQIARAPAFTPQQLASPPTAGWPTGESGKGGSHGGAPLTTSLTRESIVNIVTRGRNDMPPFGSALSPDQLADLTSYVLTLAATNPAR
jgi:hypothetical protein